MFETTGRDMDEITSCSNGKTISLSTSIRPWVDGGARGDTLCRMPNVVLDLFNKVTTKETYRKPEHVASAKDRRALLRHCWQSRASKNCTLRGSARPVSPVDYHPSRHTNNALLGWSMGGRTVTAFKKRTLPAEATVDNGSLCRDERKDIRKGTRWS